MEVESNKKIAESSLFFMDYGVPYPMSGKKNEGLWKNALIFAVKYWEHEYESMKY